jgi:hypothetical protein
MSQPLKKSNRPALVDSKAAARKMATLISLPFAAVGFIAFIILLHDGILGGLTRDSAIKLASVIIVAAGFIVLVFGIIAKKTSMAEQLRASLLEDPDKPWLKRADWAGGRIKSLGIPDAKSYLIMGIVLTVLGITILSFVIPVIIRTHSYSDLVAVLFPVVGIVFLTNVVFRIRASKRFGDCYFEMAQIPASPGGVLEGIIRTELPLKPEQKFGIQISCLRKIVAGAGQHRRADETVLWKESSVAKIPANPEAGGGKVPVSFVLPPDQPQCSQRGNETVSWRLDLKIPGDNFHATFDVPVFKIAAPPVPAINA